MLSPVNSIIAYGAAFNSFRMLIGAISALYLLSNGVTLTQLGLLKTFQAVVIFLLEIPLSYLADKKSKKMSVIISVLTGSIWLLLTGLGTDLWHFFVAEAFNAISIALSSGSLISYMVDTGKKHHPEIHSKVWIGRGQKVQFLGMGVFSFIGAAFVDVESSLIWMIAGFSCLALAIVFSWFLPSDTNNSEIKESNGFIKDVVEVFKTQAKTYYPF